MLFNLILGMHCQLLPPRLLVFALSNTVLRSVLCLSSGSILCLLLDIARGGVAVFPHIACTACSEYYSIATCLQLFSTLPLVALRWASSSVYVL